MSKTKVKTEKGVVKKLRAIRDKMNEDMQEMNFVEMKAYLKEMKERPPYNKR